MSGNCDHGGFHSGMGKLSRDFHSIRFVVVCDVCGTEIREVDVQEYAPNHDPSGTGANRGRRAA
jgi:hypothetical protein